MSEHVCKECGKSFESRRGLHQHMKAHFDCVGDYYVKHFPRKDLFTGHQLPYKNYDQYFGAPFAKAENFIEWIKVAPEQEARQLVIEQIKEKADKKELKSLPCNLFYDLYQLPNLFALKHLWNTYSEFSQAVGLPVKFNKRLPKNFWDDVPEDMKILIDTREQLPMSFDNSMTQKLDFGDYAVAGQYYSPTFVDRKSQDDFRSTFGKDIDRFRREMDRCVEFGSYMFVVIESHIDKIETENKYNKFKSNLTYLWHNVRDLMATYPDNLQFVFAHNRAGAEKIIPKILYHGKDLWDLDLQYAIDDKIFGKQHIYQLS